MVKIQKIWEYEREACDCCEGWWNERYELTVFDELVGVYSELEDALLEASSRTMDFEFIDDVGPIDD